MKAGWRLHTSQKPIAVVSARGAGAWGRGGGARGVRGARRGGSEGSVRCGRNGSGHSRGVPRQRTHAVLVEHKHAAVLVIQEVCNGLPAFGAARPTRRSGSAGAGGGGGGGGAKGDYGRGGGGQRGRVSQLGGGEGGHSNSHCFGCGEALVDSVLLHTLECTTDSDLEPVKTVVGLRAIVTHVACGVTWLNRTTRQQRTASTLTHDSSRQTTPRCSSTTSSHTISKHALLCNGATLGGGGHKGQDPSER
jgi:hypothetical protein